MGIGTPEEKSHRKGGGERRETRKNAHPSVFFFPPMFSRVPRIESRSRVHIESFEAYRSRYGYLNTFHVASCQVLERKRGIIWSTWFDSTREGFLKAGSGSRSLVTRKERKEPSLQRGEGNLGGRSCESRKEKFHRGRESKETNE